MYEPVHKKRYRPCVGICLFNAQGHVFVAERIDAPDAWQMPQGGINEGEDPFLAALREMEEEIGTGRARFLGRLDDWLYYELPKEIRKKVWHGHYVGQKQIWYAFQFEGREEEINLSTDHPEFARYKWVPLDETIDLIVPFKREVYREIMIAFRRFSKV